MSILKNVVKYFMNLKKISSEGFHDTVIKKLSQCPLLLKYIKYEDKTEEMIQNMIIALDWGQLEKIQKFIPAMFKKTNQKTPVPYLKSDRFFKEVVPQSVNALYFLEPAAQETLANKYIEDNGDLLQFASQEKKMIKKLLWLQFNKMEWHFNGLLRH